MSVAISCLALHKQRRCTAIPAAGSRWCVQHEEQQAKSLKSYKRLSYELEVCQAVHTIYKDIQACTSPSTLHVWADAMRKRWVLSQRTIDARIKHHTAFCGGGDSAHLAFVNTLTAQKDDLERLLFAIDDRAYSLLLQKEQAEWLEVQPLAGPSCQEEVVIPTINEFGLGSAISDAESPSEASDTSDSDDNVFSDVSTETASSASCTSDCCHSPKTQKIRIATHRQRLLAYFDYPLLFNHDPPAAKIAQGIIDNVFRTVIARTPRLLVRAKQTMCDSVKRFLADDNFSDDECSRLWRAMKHQNINQEGKISVEVMRNAVWGAENVDAPREGAFIELLGGKVYKSASKTELTEDGWHHFYRFTSCSGCALSVTQTFDAWSRNRRLSSPTGLYAAWSEPGETHSEAALRKMGVVLAGFYKKGKTGALEHVKPKRKGVKSVWIERDSRNYVFLRFSNRSPGLSSLCGATRQDLSMWTWPLQEGLEAEEGDSIWMSRLRSGNTPAERKRARWTTDTSFRYTECTRQRLLSTSPETYFHGGKPFEGSVDAVVVDTSTPQDYEDFLTRIVDALRTSESEEVAVISSTSMNDKALYLARQFFREST